MCWMLAMPFFIACRFNKGFTIQDSNSAFIILQDALVLNRVSVLKNLKQETILRLTILIKIQKNQLKK